MKHVRRANQKLVLNSEVVLHLTQIATRDLHWIQGGEQATGVTEDVNKCSNNSYCTKPI